MISVAQRRRLLGRRTLLTAPATDVETIAGTLVGVHSSDPATVPLTFRARLPSVAVADIDDALYERRTLLRIHGMRRTLFVADHDLAHVMNSACTRALVERERARFVKMVEDEGLVDDASPWIDDLGAAIERSLANRVEATAVELTEDVPDLGKRIAYGVGKKYESTMGVSTRMLFLLATEGRIARSRPMGTWVSGQYRWCLIETALPGGFKPLDPAEARAELAHRYLATYGPATTDDVKWWTGWTLTQTRAALRAIGAVDVEVETGEGSSASAWLLAGDPVATGRPADADGDPWVALLPSLDSTVMGWKERAWYLGLHRPRVFDRNGNAGQTIWVDGRIVGGWALGPTGDVRIQVLEDIGRERQELVAAEAHRLEAWLGGVRVMPRFASPLDRELSR